MGIYSSGMSCWQRRKAGLAQDNAGFGVIGETKSVDVPVIKTLEEVEIPIPVEETIKIEYQEEPQPKIETPEEPVVPAIEVVIEGEKQEEPETAGKIVPKKGKKQKDPS
jgi:hypothetical protein